MEIDYSDIIQKVVVTYVVIRVLRSYLEASTTFKKYDKYVDKAWLGALVILLFANIFKLGLVSKLYYELMLSGILFFVYESRRTYKPAQMLAIAIIPYLITSFITIFLEYFAPLFFKEMSIYIGTIDAMATFWMFGFGVYAYRQNKKELVQRQKDEEERKRIEAKKNELEFQVAERTAELTRQKEELEGALTELKATQNQLVQAEKMASLGELTAGIAHEIQNPLNFVNNFAEVSVELLEEMEEEIEKGNTEDVKAIVFDIKQNLEKINHHGKRADGIVKGMLQHSRASTGKKEFININSLADEYLRLSYHGLRAKDKTFNADFKLDLEANLPKIAVVPQDFGRVLLNLINNAFYAVQQKGKLGIEGYKPLVTISTAFFDNEAVIKIRDNGTGIPDTLKAKIFQPFFTTKPTGQGTGLGLSLAFDIVTKGHGGTIELESKEGEGTVFVITMPTD